MNIYIYIYLIQISKLSAIPVLTSSFIWVSDPCDSSFVSMSECEGSVKSSAGSSQFKMIIFTSFFLLFRSRVWFLFPGVFNTTFYLIMSCLEIIKSRFLKLDSFLPSFSFSWEDKFDSCNSSSSSSWMPTAWEINSWTSTVLFSDDSKI